MEPVRFAVHDAVVIQGVPTYSDLQLIEGLKFNDLDGDSIRDSGEPVLSGVTIQLWQNNAVVGTSVTSSNGFYSIWAPNGTYEIREMVPSGYQQTFPSSGFHTLEVGPAGIPTGLNFGNQLAPTTGSICGVKFNDLDGNGEQDRGEPGLPGWTINLTYEGAAGPVTVSVVTDENGAYCFNDLTGGAYTVSETNQDDWEQTLPSAPGTYSIDLAAGENRGSILFGNRLVPTPITLGGRKFNDINENGINDGASEEWNSPLPSVTIVATLQGTTSTWSAITNASGHFTMTVPGDGTYIVSEQPVTGYFQTFPSLALTGSTTHTVSTSNPNLLFGNKANIVLGSICGVKFNDLDGNGEQGAAEPFLPDWTFELSGDATASVITDARGAFCFNNLAPGTYTIAEANPGGWLQTVPVNPDTYTIEVVSGVTTDNLIFGNQAIVPTITLSGFKFIDLDGDSTFDGVGEAWLTPPLPGVTINVTASGASVPTASPVTDANGNFSVVVPAGPDYIVSEVVPTGYDQVFPPSATYTVSSSDNNLVFGNKVEEVCVSPPPSGMRGWWSADNTADDMSGWGNHGTLQPGATYGAGKVGQAFNLIDGSHYVLVPDAPSLNFGPLQNFSIDAWIAMTGGSSSSRIVFKMYYDPQLGTYHGYNLEVSGGKLVFQMSDGPSSPVYFYSTAPNISDGALHFVAVTVDRQDALGIKMYIDGVLVDEFSPLPYPGSLSNTSDFSIGRGGGSPNEIGFDGLIDEVELFDRVLTPSEITSIYNAQGSGKCKNTMGFIQGKKFNDIDGGGEYDGPLEDWLTPSLPSVTITALSNSGNGTFSTTTLSDGTFTLALEPDTYTVSEGAVAGYTQTRPASNGSYGVVVTAGNINTGHDFGNQADGALGQICGLKFNDLNENGDQDQGEPGLQGWTITLTYEGAAGPVTVSVVTDENGAYCFNDLTEGTYTVSETNQDGWNQTFPPFLGAHSVTLNPGENRMEIDFGNHEITTGIMEGVKYLDSDEDGERDPGEPALQGVTILLYQNGVVVDTTMTDQNGLYSFVVEAGTYTLTERVPFGYEQTEPSNGGGHTVTVLANGTFSDLDFGNKIATTGRITGLKYNDLDGDGEKDSLEPGLSGVEIILYQNGVPVDWAITDAQGNYFFSRPAGTYTLEETIPTGYVQKEPINGFHPVTLSPGGLENGFNFGNQLVTNNGDICGYKFNDLNGDGDQDPGEMGMLGWTIQLDNISSPGSVPVTTTTNDKGDYCFRDLPPGTYTISEPPVPGWTQTKPQPPGTHSVTLSGGSSVRGIIFGNMLQLTTGSICGVKYNDLNDNGKRDDGEPGIPEWSINLGGPITDGTTTDINGKYCFDDLNPGTYSVAEIQRERWTQTDPVGPDTYTLAVGAGDRFEDIDFGNRLELPGGSICGYKFNDLNRDGIKDPGEPGIAEWPINLDWRAVASTVTDRDGAYCFNNLDQGDYEVTEEQRLGWTQTLPSGGVGHQLNLGLDQERLNLNFGNAVSPEREAICGLKFNDLNGNGKRDAGEPGIPDWQINLSGPLDRSILTDKNGTFCFSGVPTGDYRVAEEGQTGWRQTMPPNQGSYQFNFNASQSVANLNFGNTRNECTTGFKSWSPMGLGMNGRISALEVYNGSLFAGGSFSMAGGNTNNNIAEWNGSHWTFVSSGTNGEVLALEAVGNNLFVAGDFTTAGGVSANSIAKWNATSGWTALGKGIMGTVRALQAIGPDLYAAGSFATAGGVVVNSIAKWDGSTWSTLANGTPGYFYALTELNGQLIAGGVFFNIGGVSTSHIAKWDGTAWSAIGGGVGSTVTSLAAHGGDLYAGGDFQAAGGQAVHRIAKWNGSTWSDIGGGFTTDYVRSLYFMGTDLYAGGDFTTSGTTTVNHVAKWDGIAWSPLSTGLNQWYASALIEYGGGLVAGGWFTTAGGTSANHIAMYRCNDPLIDGGTIIGTIFNDFNDDGIKDPKEPVLGGWPVLVTNGGVVTTTISDPNGFTFTGIQAGTVGVSIALQDGWSHSGTSTGTQTFDFQSEIGLTGINFGVLKNPVQECAAPPAGMKAWWTFDEGAMGGTSIDRAEFNNVGIHVRGTASVQGKVGGALHFDGKSGFVKVADKTGLEFGMGDFTFDAWIRTTDMEGHLIGDIPLNSLSNSGYQVFIKGGLLSLWLKKPTYGLVQYSVVQAFVSDGNWHHIAVTISRNEPLGVTLYVDGEAFLSPISFLPGTILHTSYPIWIGGNTSWRWFEGDLDEIELFDRALSAAEINSIYLAGSAGKCKSPLNTGTVGGSIFNDLNQDGVKGPLEAGLPNVNVMLMGAEPLEAWSDEEGNFHFADVMQGSYDLEIDLPAGWSLEGGSGNAYPFEIKPFDKISPLNFSFTPEECRESTKIWSPLGPGLNDLVTSLALQGSSLYAGGWFTASGSTQVDHVAKWNGTSWSPLGRGVNGNVYALLVVGPDLYVGGDFTTAGGVPALNIAKWNGTTWSAVGAGMNQPVRALEAVGTAVYAGGDFTTAGGIPANYIASWDGTSWSAVGIGMNNSVFALTRSGAALYAGGAFTSAGGIPAGKVAKWSGTSWTAMGAGIQPSSGTVVYTLQMVQSHLYAGGLFTSVGGVPSMNLGRWDETNSMWSSIGHIGPRAYALENVGSDLYVGGWMGTIHYAGTQLNVGDIARWDDSNWSALGSIGNNGVNTATGTAGTSDVLAITANGSTVYAGGAFLSAAGTSGLISANHVAMFSCPAPVDTSVEGPDSSVELPQQVLLAQNYPNPFNAMTRIRYELPEVGLVKLEVYDVLGRRVQTVVNEIKAAGVYEVVFDANYLSSGMYLYRLSTGASMQTRKMILLK